MLTPGYTILRGVSYKSGTPKALLVSSNTQNDDDKNDDSRGSEATLQDTMIVPAPPLVEVPSSDGDTKSLVPKYTIVKQGVSNMNVLVPQRPKQLIVSIYLNKVTSAANIYLGVSGQLMVVKPDSKLDVRYNLKLQLPYPVNSQKGNANSIIQQRALVVTLPVVA